MPPSVLLLVGTDHGLYLLRSGADPRDWQVEGPLLKGWSADAVAFDLRAEPLLVAGLSSRIYGPHLQLSHDLGRSWQPVQPGPWLQRPPRIPPHPNPQAEPHPAAVRPRLRGFWTLQPGRQPGSLWAGVSDAALFHSPDRGRTWRLVEGLYDHPSRAEWEPDRGGLSVHSLIEAPQGRLWVGISAVGVLRSRDGGITWEVANRGVRAWWPGWQRCVHRLIGEQHRPGVLYQQGHTGVYRSLDGGDTWEPIEAGLPSVYGFPMVAHPHRSGTLYVVPAESDEVRMPPGGRLRVYRTTDGGQSWHALERGLPQLTYQAVLRQAMDADSLDPAGLYLGTAGGMLFASPDEGDSWLRLPGNYPRILTVRAAVVG